MSDDPDAGRTRVTLGVVTVLLAILFGFASVLAVIAGAIGTCDGDGGDPYSARDSTAGRFCELGVSDVYFAVELVGPSLCMLVLGVIGCVRLRGQFVVIGFVVSLILLLVLAVIPSSLSDRCSPEQLRAGADCQTY